MWGRMWSFGRGSGSRSGGGSDPERERHVRSDAVRKRGARRWTNRGMSPAASFRRSETEEYDRPRVLLFREMFVCRSSSSSDAGLLPVKREWSEDEEEPKEPDEFDFGPVMEEPEEPASLGRRGVVGPKDYVADVDAVAAASAERSMHEGGGAPTSRRGARRPQWRQAVDANLAAKEKYEEWRRIREEHMAKYIDLCSSGEEDCASFSSTASSICRDLAAVRSDPL
ncbi:cdpk-related protein kinase [Hordeum vulgare]|nr:cdpk-related protein kinase [Hordeum vulgare]